MSNDIEVVFNSEDGSFIAFGSELFKCKPFYKNYTIISNQSNQPRRAKHLREIP